MVHFRIASDGMDDFPNAPEDWYIKGARYISSAMVPNVSLIVPSKARRTSTLRGPLYAPVGYRYPPDYVVLNPNSFNRPETIESLFIAYRLTGDSRYRDHGWRIFESIERHCRVETGGYATVVNVDEVPSRKEDKMETFLMVRLGSPSRVPRLTLQRHHRARP